MTHSLDDKDVIKDRVQEPAAIWDWSQGKPFQPPFPSYLRNPHSNPGYFSATAWRRYYWLAVRLDAAQAIRAIPYWYRLWKKYEDTLIWYESTEGRLQEEEEEAKEL